jgi:hypothetical protein
MAVVQNISGIIATEVGHGLGAAMQNAAITGKQMAGGTIGSEGAKPYSRPSSHPLRVSWGKKVKFLMKIWRLFKTHKTPTYDHLRWSQTQDVTLG